MSRLKKMYDEQITSQFLKDGYTNYFAVPKVKKVLVNVGVGKLRGNTGYVEQVNKNMIAITGQKPTVRRSRKAISGFKVRIGDEVGLLVTLRGEKMYDFLDKLANVTLPRIRDFRGLDPKSFGRTGNFSLGISEVTYFPESASHTENIHPLEVTIVTTAKNEIEGQKLLKALGFPFKKIESEAHHG